jgi:glycosyltransferase involved in cell wall biosynthesis
VTLGLVVKNEEKNLKETIESINNQDYPHQLIEVIVVDGMSQDNTMRIVAEGFREDISLRIFRTNKGLGQSRQIVVDCAKGKYIIWVDGDMVIPRNFVRKQVTFMEEHPKAGIGACYLAYKKGLNWIANIQNILYIVGQEFFCSIFRKDVLKGVGGFDTTIKGAGEDVDVITRIVAAGWSLTKNPDVRIYHNSSKTLESFLKRAEWYGSGRHFLRHKYKPMYPLWMATPMVSFAYGLKKSVEAYRLEHKKEFFLMPFLLLVGNLFWWLGFIRGHLNGYGHNQIRNNSKICEL